MWHPQVRTAFESYAKPDASPAERMAGANRFVQEFYANLGIVKDESGRLVRRDPKMSPSEFSIRGLAESLCGYDWAEGLGHHLAESHRVFEAGGNAAITPGNLPNVSAYLGSVAGLLDASVLEGYDTPEFQIDKLIPTVSSKTRQKVIIGTGRVGDAARRRNPGDPHEFVQFGERRIVTSETQNDALACQVTFESVFFDQTGEVLEKANTIGRELALRKELDGFRLIAGVTNPYNYNGVAYNTYATSGNWVNDVANQLSDWTDINVVNAMFGRMKDQETGNRISVKWDTLLCSPTKKLTAEYIQAATEVRSRTKSGTVATSSPRLGDVYEVVESVYLDQVLTDAVAVGGLALTQAAADQYWWAIKTDKKASAFVRVENWPVTISRAAPQDYTMLNNKLLLSVFADQMHSFDVKEPRFVIRCKNE